MARQCGGNRQVAALSRESGLHNPSLQFEDCRKRADSLISAEGAEDDNHGSDHD
jgi:hypothetical protein